MSNRLANPNPQFFDNSGEPLNGGVLRFYLTTTSTPAQTYSNAALTISNGSAITLDSAGRSPVSIFLDPAVTLKVTLETSAGVVLWTRDPVVDLAANINASVQVYAGNPNTHVAGNAGTPGSTGASLLYDITNSILYICTTTGTATTAAWTSISNSFTGGEDIYTTSQTITAANIGRIATANSATPITFTFTAAATLGASKLFVFKNIGAGALTLDPAGAELIEGIADLIILQNQSVIVECTGGTFRVIGMYDGLMDTLGRTSFPTEITVASAATCDILGAASEAVAISGVVTVTSFGTGPNRHRYCRATGIFIITYNATTLITPGAANITTAVGDTWELISDASSNVRIINYQRTTGLPPVTFGSALASFRATKTANQTGIVNGTPTAVTYDTEDFDVGAHFSTGTSLWTPPAGTCLVAASLKLSGVNLLASTQEISIYKNGAPLKTFGTTQPAGSSCGLSISVIDQCNGTDTYGVYVSPATSVTGTVLAQDLAGTGSRATFFEGTMI